VRAPKKSRIGAAAKPLPPTPGLGSGGDWGAALKRSSFSPGALALDRQGRDDLALFYGYCRAIDDCADEYAPQDAARHLALWKAELALLHRGRPASVLGLGLAELCARRGIPAGLLDDLWQGARSDARIRVRHKTWAGVRHYCYQVAGSVGLACLPIFGLDLEAASTYGLALGEAFQLINIIRDLKEDAAKDRLYFALEDLAAHGLRAEDFMRGTASAGSQRLIHAYAWRARHALRRADEEARALPRAGLRPSRLMRALYGGLLERMEEDGFRVFERRYSLGAGRKFQALAWGLWPF
jgi:phytoene synthase